MKGTTENIVLAGLVFLFLAVSCSVIIATLLRFSERRGGSRLVLIASNYIVAFGVSSLRWWLGNQVMPDGASCLLGLAGGTVFIGAFLLMTAAIGRVGIAVPVAITRLSVIVPILFTILVYGEHPHWLQAGGLILALAALGVFGWSALGGTRSVNLPWNRLFLLLGLLFSMGSVEVVLKVFREHNPDNSQKYAFMSIIFGFALLLGWLLVWLRREEVRRQDVILGLVLGLPNVLSTDFILQALLRLKGIVVFPINSMSIIVLSALVGFIIWREKPGRWGLVGLALALAAIALIV